MKLAYIDDRIITMPRRFLLLVRQSARWPAMIAIGSRLSPIIAARGDDFVEHQPMAGHAQAPQKLLARHAAISRHFGTAHCIRDILQVEPMNTFPRWLAICHFGATSLFS